MEIGGEKDQDLGRAARRGENLHFLMFPDFVFDYCFASPDFVLDLFF